MIWRMLSDDPGFDTNNYHGIAERFCSFATACKSIVASGPRGASRAGRRAW